MWGIRLLRTIVTLALAAGALVAVPALVVPAGAAPATCTTTYSTQVTKTIKAASCAVGAYEVDWIDIQVPETRAVVDVNFGFYLSTPNASGMAFSMDTPQTVDAIKGPRSTAEGAAGPVNGTYTLDDEAVAPFAAVSPPSGTYRPQRAASELDGRSAVGRWRLLIANTSTTSGTWGNATLTLTVDCDVDKDGVADVSDNCPATVNADQANNDDDALGDACDLDIDGDNLANAADGCPRLPAATKTGCPEVGRTASLRYAKATRKLKAVVRSDVPTCRTDAKVTLYRAKPGKDTKLVVGTTNTQGRWTRKAPKAAGRYYVKVAASYAKNEAECGRARSKKERVS